MSEIVAAIDEGAAQQLFDTTIASIGPLSTSGTSSLGPFGVSYAVGGTLSNGTVDLHRARHHPDPGPEAGLGRRPDVPARHR